LLRVVMMTLAPQAANVFAVSNPIEPGEVPVTMAVFPVRSVTGAIGAEPKSVRPRWRIIFGMSSKFIILVPSK